jgi:hypothetical protein
MIIRVSTDWTGRFGSPRRERLHHPPPHPNGTNILGGSQILRRLRDRGLLELDPAGSLSFYTLVPMPRPADAADRGAQTLDRGEQAGPVAAGGPRGPWGSAGEGSPAWLAEQLGIYPCKISERRLGPMVKVGVLERRVPYVATHAEQACRSKKTHGSLQIQTIPLNANSAPNIKIQWSRP